MLDIKRIREDYENVKAGVERRTNKNLLWGNVGQPAENNND